MTRSLGRKHRIYVGSTTPRLFRLQRLLKSRACANVVRVADPEADARGFVRDVNRLTAELQLDALLPYSDQVATAASFYQDELDLAVPLPPYETFAIAVDKLRTTELAGELGIPTPVTMSGDDPEEILAWMRAHGFAFPIVLKPRRRGGRTGTVIVQSEARLRAHLEDFRRIGDGLPMHDHRKPLVQEFVPGPSHDACMLYDSGRARAQLTQVRERTLGGAGIVNRTTDIEVIKERSRRLLDALGWHGPAQVEWKLDERDGEYRLIEINPRFWAALELSIDAGLDFAELTARMLGGAELDEVPAYRVGVKHRWAFPEELLSIALDRGRAGARLRDYLRWSDLRDPDCHLSPSPSDPLPELFRALEFGLHVVQRREALRQRETPR